MSFLCAHAAVVTAKHVTIFWGRGFVKLLVVTSGIGIGNPPIACVNTVRYYVCACATEF